MICCTEPVVSRIEGTTGISAIISLKESQYDFLTGVDRRWQQEQQDEEFSDYTDRLLFTLDFIEDIGYGRR